MVWIIYSLIFNTPAILPNFPGVETPTPTPEVLAPAAPTEAAANEVPPPPPPPPPPTEDERCLLFDEVDISLVTLNIIDGTYNIPIYLKMLPEVPGGGKTGDIGETVLPLEAWMDGIPAYKCDLQGFPDRLYCMFTLKPDMPGTEQFFQLKMEICEKALFAQDILLPEIQLAEEENNEPPGCHAGLDARSCKSLGGEYRQIKDGIYLCFCP